MRANTTTWQTRLTICYTIPHLTAFLSFLILTLYVTITIRAENARQQQAHHLANRAALVYQADDINALSKSLVSLNQHLHHPYKLIILHTSLSPSTQGRLQALSETPISFRQLALSSFNHTLVDNLTTITTRFWSVTALLHDPTTILFSDLDYIIRLSSHAIFTTSVKQDVIKSFVAQGSQYGYHKITNYCNNITALRQLATSYVDLNGIQPRCQPLWQRILDSPCLPAFTGAFEILNLRFFRSHSGIQDFLRVVDANRAFISNSSHERLIRFITVALYAAPGKVLQFENKVPFRITPHIAL